MSDTQTGAQRLLLAVMYSSPWDKAARWLLKSDKVELDENDELVSIRGNPRDVVSDDSWRCQLSDWCERRDIKWREKYVKRGVRPPERWKRK